MVLIFWPTAKIGSSAFMPTISSWLANKLGVKMFRFCKKQRSNQEIKVKANKLISEHHKNRLTWHKVSEPYKNKKCKLSHKLGLKH